ncbi:MAG: YfhO family protein, partial [Candidatus Binatia bacterium]
MRPRLAIALTAAVLSAAFVSPALLSGQVPVYRDFLNVFLPERLYAARAFEAGQWPLWAPEPGLGVAFLASYQPAPLLPLAAIVYLLPGPAGIGLFLALHFALAGIGVSLLLERYGAAPEARLFAAITYAFGGVFVSIAAWGHLTVAALLPLVLLAVEDVARRASRGAFVLLVALLATQALAGAPESFAQSVALVAAAAAWIALRERRAAPIPSLAAALALALGVTAAQLVPAAEAVLLSERSGGLGEAAVLRHSLEPVTFRTLVVPHRIDGGVVGAVAEEEFPLVWSIYIGLVPLLFATAGAVAPGGWPWVAALAVALAFALGGNAPFLPLVHG